MWNIYTRLEAPIFSFRRIIIQWITINSKVCPRECHALRQRRMSTTIVVKLQFSKSNYYLTSPSSSMTSPPSSLEQPIRNLRMRILVVGEDVAEGFQCLRVEVSECGLAHRVRDKHFSPQECRRGRTRALVMRLLHALALNATIELCNTPWP
jgi:hypothetical protein